MNAQNLQRQARGQRLGQRRAGLIPLRALEHVRVVCSPHHARVHKHTHTHTRHYIHHDETHNDAHTAKKQVCFSSLLAPSRILNQGALSRLHARAHTHTPVLPSRFSSESDGQWATPCVASTARPSALMPHPASPPPNHQCTYEVQEGALHHNATTLSSFRLASPNKHTDIPMHMPLHTRGFIYVHICRLTHVCIYVFAVPVSLILLPPSASPRTT